MHMAFSMKVTPEIEELTNICLDNSKMDVSLYGQYDVKRGLRDINGVGVLAGLTQISNVVSSDIIDGVKTPCDGRLYYRGINVEKLTQGFLSENRMGFEEVAYLLLFGNLPNEEQLNHFKTILKQQQSLPKNFVRDVVMKAPTKDMMNTLSRSVLTQGKKPYKDLDAAQIVSAKVLLTPPDKTIEIENIQELVEYLNDVVVYNEDNSYTEYDGQGVVFTLTMVDGTQTDIMAYNPFIVIDGIGYKTKYEPCEALNSYANELLNSGTANIILEEPPTLSVVSDETAIGAVLGTYSWQKTNIDGTAESTIADSPHPLECKDLLSPPFETTETTATLRFTEDPDTILSVQCWSDEHWGEPATNSEDVTIVGNVELWFTERHTPSVKFSIKVDRQLYTAQSEFQRIDVFDSKEFGRFLTLDGYMMLTEKDEFIYHEMMVHVPMAVHPNARRVLIIGAGDGGVVRELTRYHQIEHIDLVEIDELVVEVCKKYLPQTACRLDDERVHIYYEDGLKFIRSKENEYDLIIVDSTDPFGPGVLC